ncbi:30S ribosome-binding factor RbfA [Lentisphaerota bacterium ZTH]|nr:30S ribosome-binding factor RbfA [Lentisphaerota bacterium]WET07630.1 30S ribosome-binding factor RbfA [Lentisphaerota bacterium ZTH]
MPSVDRITRVNELLKREIADLIERSGIAPSKSVLVSVTEVKTSVDLRKALVFISVFGGDKNTKEAVIKKLHKNRADLQKSISRVISLKYTPVLKFTLDDRLESGDRVLSILEESEHNDEK